MDALILIGLMVAALMLAVAPYLFLVWVGANIVKWVFAKPANTVAPSLPKDELTAEQEATLNAMIKCAFDGTHERT